MQVITSTSNVKIDIECPKCVNEHENSSKVISKKNKKLNINHDLFTPDIYKIIYSFMPGLCGNKKVYKGLVKAKESDKFDFWVKSYYFIENRPRRNAVLKRDNELKLLIPMELNIKFETGDIDDYEHSVSELLIEKFGWRTFSGKYILLRKYMCIGGKIT